MTSKHFLSGLLVSSGTMCSLCAAAPDFRAETIDSEIQIGYGLAIGDVNGDGKQDVLLADRFEIVWYENPTWEKHQIAGKLSLRDHVCIASEDIDGDGKVEIAVGANWNPGETSDRMNSGSVHYLIRPDEEGKPWKSVDLPHEPTVHRMAWVKHPEGGFRLVVVPLHGEGNRNGEGENGVKVHAYERPEGDSVADPQAWKRELLDDRLHMTHNFDVLESTVLIGGREGLRLVALDEPGEGQHVLGTDGETMESGGVSEVRRGPEDVSDHPQSVATIEPMHGQNVVVYQGETLEHRTILDTTLNAGHGLAYGKFFPGEDAQVVAGWRSPDTEGKVGIKMYVPQDDGSWETHWIDENAMACEDLKAADLNGDGKLDLIASGRDTKNVIIYWNETSE